MFKQIKLQSLFIASILLLASCSKDDPDEIHDHEINKVVLHFTNTADNSSFEVEWELEHEGEEHADDDEHAHEGHIELAPNSTYSVEAEFYNTGEHGEDSDDHDHDHDGDHEEEGENITPKIIKEKDLHYIFYEFVGLNNLTINSADDDEIDTNGFGINLNTIWTTTAEESGDLKLYLIHEPQLKKGSVRNDFGGEDDVIAEFEVHIEVED
jgi:hypothetical protein